MLKEKPFIHLFVTNNNYFLFDVNTNTIVNISNKMYLVFEQILKLENNNIQELLDDEVSLKISKMISHGLLKPYPKDLIIEHPSTETLSSQLSRNVSFITLQLTQNCNLRCKYCVYSGSYQNRVHSNKRMTYETAKAAIDFLWQHSSGSKNIYIGFYGGEPLLEFNLIKKIIPYIEEKFEGRNIEYSITTNSTVITQEIADYLAKYKFKVLISLDGPKEIQDKNRVFADGENGTFDTVISKVNLLLERHPEMMERLSFNAVFDEDSNFSCSNNFFMDYPTVKKLMVTGNDISESYTKNSYKYREVYHTNKEYEVFKLYLACLNRYKWESVSKFIKNYSQVLEDDIHKRLKTELVFGKKAHPSGPCIPGINRLFITVDGKLFPCERVSEISDITNIGNIYDGFNLQKADTILNVGRITKEQCKKCWAFNRCSLCISTADDNGTLSAKSRLMWCNKVRSSVENMLKDYCVLRQYGYDFDRKKGNI